MLIHLSSTYNSSYLSNSKFTLQLMSLKLNMGLLPTYWKCIKIILVDVPITTLHFEKFIGT